MNRLIRRKNLLLVVRLAVKVLEEAQEVLLAGIIGLARILAETGTTLYLEMYTRLVETIKSGVLVRPDQAMIYQ